MKLVSAAAFLAALLMLFLAFFPSPPRRYVPALTEAACEASGWQSAGRAPFYVLPQAEGLKMEMPARYQLLKDALEKMEPGGPAGRVQLGYTLPEPPLSFYVKKGGRWELDLSTLDRDLAKAAELGRPFAVYAIADHYQWYFLPFVAEMRKDPRNLMHYRDGSVPDEFFMGFHLSSFTLSSDEKLPVVKATNDALRGMATRLAAFDKAHPGLLVGIELNGETHYMFRHFFTGTGEYGAPEMTDYSDASIEAFGQYLKERGVADAPGRIRQIDFRHGEGGMVPVSGWVRGPEAIDRVALYVDGTKRDEAIYPTSRMDVYEIPAEKLRSPNIGFGRWLDMAGLAPGRHLLQVVAEAGETRIEIGKRSIDIGVVNGSPSTPPGITAEKLGGGWQGSVDQPGNEYAVRVDPLARQWLAFRNAQVAEHIAAQAKIFRAAGLPEERIFSYQFAPWMVGGWNDMLFGIGRDFFRLPGMIPGINTYNGNLMNPRAFAYVDRSRGYAIPESHPQMAGQEQIAETLRWHYCHGAIYIGPYFLKLLYENPLNSHDRFRISEDNPVWGSDDYYRALRDFVRH